MYCLQGLTENEPEETADDPTSKEGPSFPYRLRRPSPADGPKVTALIRACPPLDVNSAYCNLLQCSHFAGTCVVAEREGGIEGWISGYIPPDSTDHFFVWQVAVADTARGLGLGGRMLDHLLSRPAAKGVDTLITTITESNDASLALFSGFARRRKATLHKQPYFERNTHFAGKHDTEWLITIGPLASTATDRPNAQPSEN
ncbi:MAG TPA: diaminobutyrate acetyltransferase [Alphaproteobacteria bacterium]|jgi:L-2,4-diaminobutyric acid acetyltransferase|nr:diaminobutyrate acetyltransferase [Alphaproteobacteria bacterium]